MGFRRGPWTVEEDLILINYVATHGEGHWNSLPRSAGLNRTGRCCRLRWLKYMRPDVRSGSFTLEEQLLILELHARWGNRWSRIARFLPGRKDNEINNYWRTTVARHAKLLKCDVNSKQFRDTMRYLLVPRLVERIQAASKLASSNRTPSEPESFSSTNMGYAVQVQEQEQSGWSSNAERLPKRTDNEMENHRHNNLETRSALDAERLPERTDNETKNHRHNQLEMRSTGKGTTCDFNGNHDNNSECPWPLLTQSSEDKDNQRESDSNSDEYSGPS